MEVYVPSHEGDGLLLQWWSTLVEQDDLAKLFAAEAQTPSSFLATFQSPTVLCYEKDARGIAAAVWFTHALSGAMLALWARADWRGGKWRPLVIEAMRQVFTLVPIVLFVTRGPHVQKAAREMGFVVQGEPIPYIYMGQEATLGYMTRERFEEIYGRQ